MNNYLDGYDRKEVTLKAGRFVQKGTTVSMEDNFTVKASGGGDAFIGVCTAVESGSASVLLSGFVTLSYSGEAPVCGFSKLSANGSGGVKKDDSGRDILVVEVDTTAMTCGIIL